ncbi:MAG TPA: hypothetical protein PKC60_05765 [Hydrogenophaga sp.]|uniref:hypothetical protein n=1 Tax=Hydrogenophaga sp. TaxID=1904254 RepID=UPI002BFA938F|nr:hypothetical protein [Hydrogenophaga sp.]HMN92721.1 hypothetical protein [Hydrogenophaga sp.]HMP08879.1 hypothetical protein [Hydrogenophaga sp.]
MKSRSQRVAAMEQMKPNLQTMTDEQLRSYARSKHPGSHDQIAAVVKLVCRRGSALPVVPIDPDKARVAGTFRRPINHPSA